ncbi:MAG: hypothetical protein WBC29_00745 [Candidatus Moraniibacteriota bacterium]
MTKKVFIWYVLISFVLNFLWEVSQVGLYTPHFDGVLELVLVHLKAALGDVVIFLVLYVLVGLFLRDSRWIEKNKIPPLFLLAILGGAFAVAIEKYALLTGRWGYSEFMPIAPFVGVGFSPVLQIIVLTPLTVFIMRWYSVKITKNNELVP